MKKLAYILPLIVLTASGCASSRLSYTAHKIITHPVFSIAMSPSGGLLADAVAVELSNAGYQVYDTQQTEQLFARLNITEVELMRPQKLSSLKGSGVDAYLSVRTAAAYDGLPQSASVRLNSTHTGQIITGLSWQNGWGGQAGSIADRTMRKDLAAASQEIARALILSLRNAPKKRKTWKQNEFTGRYEAVEE